MLIRLYPILLLLLLLCKWIKNKWNIKIKSLELISLHFVYKYYTFFKEHSGEFPEMAIQISRHAMRLISVIKSVPHQQDPSNLCNFLCKMDRVIMLTLLIIYIASRSSNESQKIFRPIGSKKVYRSASACCIWFADWKDRFSMKGAYKCIFCSCGLRRLFSQLKIP